MRRTTPVVASFASLLLLAGCGYKGTVQPRPVTVIGALPKQTTTGAAAGGPSAGATNGKAIFASSGCGACHTYGPAGASGKIGPDVDKLAGRSEEHTSELQS